MTLEGRNININFCDLLYISGNFGYSAVSVVPATGVPDS